jgi:predicted RNase H-like nuclease (RuvC/YqgF family)
MKKSELITLICGIACVGGLFVLFAVSSNIARAKSDTRIAKEALTLEQNRSKFLENQSDELKKKCNDLEKRVDTLSSELAQTQAKWHELQSRIQVKEQAERERLQYDWDWVQAEDSIDAYKKFATRFPEHPQITQIQKRIIDLEVKEIAAGEYGELPKAQAISVGGTTSEVEIENKTGYVLTVRYSGNDSKMIVVPVSATKSVSLIPGEYQVAASVSAAHVRNYFGSDSMAGGKYFSSFYIKTTTR